MGDKMEKSKTKLLLAIIVFVAISAGTITATFAYFTANSASHEFSRYELHSAESGIAYAESGSPINLLVSGEVMKDANIDAVNPAATASNDVPIKVTLKTSVDGGQIDCTYDISYIPNVVYYNSAANISNAKEYTIKGSNNQNSDAIVETSLGNIDSKLILASDIEFSLSGVNKTAVQEWTFEVGFYNQSFNQDDNQNKDFGGKVMIENLTCKNTYN